MRAIIISAILTVAGAGRAEGPGEIRAEVRGARSGKGEVLCGLFPGAGGFPKQPAFKAASAIKDGQAVCVFPGRGAGDYAIAAFHDENGNNKLDTNMMGIPKEGVAFSNAAKARMGPPAFDAAKFSHDGTSTRLSLTLTY